MMISQKFFADHRTRQMGQNDAEVYDDGYLRVEHHNYFVTYKGTFVSLSRSEFLLLSRMARNIDRVVRTGDLWEHIWGASKPLNAESLHVSVCRLRRKFEPFGLRIDSMVSVGYTLSYSHYSEARSSATQVKEPEQIPESVLEAQC